MSKSQLLSAQILRKLGSTTLVLVCVLLLMPTPVKAGDTKPTATEISKARAECAMQKQKVRALESANADDSQLSAARAAWEHACGHAQDLISAGTGIPPPAPHSDPNTPAQ